MSQITLDKALLKKENKEIPSNSILVKANSLPKGGLTKLYVDVHEPESIIEMLRKEKGIYVEVKSLPVSDYAFSNIGIERKTLEDLYNSIVHGDKRIWRQIFNLKRAFERPILVVERWDPSFINNERKERTIYGALARIALLGVSIVVIPGRGRNFRNFVQFLSYLFFSSNKKTLSMKPVPERSKTGKKKDIISDILCMIPGIGRKTANEISSRVESIEDLCKMSDEELKKLCPRRIGPKTLATLNWILHGKELPKKKRR